MKQKRAIAMAICVLLCISASARASEIIWMDDVDSAQGRWRCPPGFEGGLLLLEYADGRGRDYFTPEGHATGLLNSGLFSEYNFSCGLVPVRQNGKWGYMDTSGVIVIPCQYDTAFPFASDSGWALVSKSDRVFYINMSGEEVFDVTDVDYTITLFQDGLFLATKSSLSADSMGYPFSADRFKYGFVNECGEIIIPIEYRNASVFHNGIALLETFSGKWGSVDTQGNWVMPCIYDDMFWASDDLIYAEGGGQKGYFDLSGQLVIDGSIYEDCAPFSEGLAAVRWNDQDGYIDKTGNMVIPPQYNDAGFFQNGFAEVRKERTVGYIDTTGNLAVTYTEAMAGTGFSEGLAELTILEDGPRSGYVDTSGNWLIPPTLQETSGAFSEGVIWVLKDERIGLLKNPLDVVSPWAERSIEQANSLGLITANTGRCYPFEITRQKFAELAANFIERATQKEIVLDSAYFPFRDTADCAVRKAAAAGVVNGLDDGSRFGPDERITREQLAVMLERAIRYIEKDTGKSILTAGDLSAYTDADQVSSWAAPSVSALAAVGIMQGTSATTLSPQDTTTVEQAILLVLRAYQAFEA